MTSPNFSSPELLLLCHLLIRAGKSSVFTRFDTADKLHELFKPLVVGGGRTSQVVSPCIALCPACGKQISASTTFLPSFWFIGATCCGDTTSHSRLWSLPLHYVHFPAEVQQILYSIVLDAPYG
jgi:hypothetical protein